MPSLAHARQAVALGSIAGIGVNRPGADVALARRVSGTDLTGVSYRVQAQHGVSTASLAAGAARAALRAANAELAAKTSSATNNQRFFDIVFILPPTGLTNFFELRF